MVSGKINSPSPLQNPGLVTELHPGILSSFWISRWWSSSPRTWMGTTWEALETLHCCWELLSSACAEESCRRACACKLCLLIPQWCCRICCTRGLLGWQDLYGFDPASAPLKSLSHSAMSLYLPHDTTCRQLQGPAKFNLLGRTVLSSVQESSTAPHQRNINRE